MKGWWFNILNFSSNKLIPSTNISWAPETVLSIGDRTMKWKMWSLSHYLTLYQGYANSQQVNKKKKKKHKQHHSISWHLNSEVSATSESVRRTFKQKVNVEPYREWGELWKTERTEWLEQSRWWKEYKWDARVRQDHLWAMKREFKFYSKCDENSLACLKQWSDIILFVFL